MTRGVRKEGLSRRNRFAGRGSFALALRSPHKLRGAAMILHVTDGRQGESRLGVATPKRLTRLAVDRNRLKRLCREAFRHHGVKTAGLDLVLTPRLGLARDGEEAWLAELRGLLDRAAERR